METSKDFLNRISLFEKHLKILTEKYKLTFNFVYVFPKYPKLEQVPQEVKTALAIINAHDPIPRLTYIDKKEGVNK